MTTSSSITSRGVKVRLSRAGVNYTALTITERDEVSRPIDLDSTGPWRRRTIVDIAGPQDTRWQASLVLMESGLACAPYGDHDQWSQ